MRARRRGAICQGQHSAKTAILASASAPGRPRKRGTGRSRWTGWSVSPFPDTPWGSARPSLTPSSLPVASGHAPEHDPARKAIGVGRGALATMGVHLPLDCHTPQPSRDKKGMRIPPLPSRPTFPNRRHERSAIDARGPRLTNVASMCPPGLHRPESPAPNPRLDGVHRNKRSGKGFAISLRHLSLHPELGISAIRDGVLRGHRKGQP
jgi:hypothetical protein